MTSKELLKIIREEERQEFSAMKLYREIFGDGSTKGTLPIFIFAT